MKRITAIVLFLFLGVSVSLAQGDFKPSVTVGATIFTGWADNVGNALPIVTLDTTMPDNNAVYGFDPKKNQFEVSKNVFYLERAYTNVIASLSPDIKARVTPDVFSYKDQSGATQFALRIKYANLYYTPVHQDNGLSVGFGLGVLPNRWIEGTENYWGYRGLQKVLTDYTWTTLITPSANSHTGKVYALTSTTGSYFSSADLGFDLRFTAPKGYAEADVNIFNGSGYAAENNPGLFPGYNTSRFKDVMVTAFIHPLMGQISKKMAMATKKNKTRIDGIADLTVGGFAYVGKLNKGEDYTVGPMGVVQAQYVRNRFGGMLHFKYNFKDAGFVRVGGELSVQSNQDPMGTATTPDSVAKVSARGLDGYLEFCPPVKQLKEKLSLIFRYDMFDPNTANDQTNSAAFPIWNNNSDQQTSMTFALAFKPEKVLTLALDYQMVSFNQPFAVKYDGTSSKTYSTFYINGIIAF